MYKIYVFTGHGHWLDGQYIICTSSKKKAESAFQLWMEQDHPKIKERDKWEMKTFPTDRTNVIHSYDGDY